MKNVLFVIYALIFGACQDFQSAALSEAQDVCIVKDVFLSESKSGVITTTGDTLQLKHNMSLKNIEKNDILLIKKRGDFVGLPSSSQKKDGNDRVFIVADIKAAYKVFHIKTVKNDIVIVPVRNNNQKVLSRLKPNDVVLMNEKSLDVECLQLLDIGFIIGMAGMCGLFLLIFVGAVCSQMQSNYFR